MIEDLTMLANLPVCEDEKADKEREDKTAAGETVPPPQEKDPTVEDNTKAEPVARRAEDAPEQELGGEEDRG